MVYGIVLDERGLAVPGVRVQAVSREVLDVRSLPAAGMVHPRPPEQHIYSARTNELGQYWLSLHPVVYDIHFWGDAVQVEWRGVIPDRETPLRLDVDLGDLPADGRAGVFDATSTPTVSTRARECSPRGI
jgi:hypothetical protein